MAAINPLPSRQKDMLLCYYSIGVVATCLVCGCLFAILLSLVSLVVVSGCLVVAVFHGLHLCVYCAGPQPICGCVGVGACVCGTLPL